MRLTPSLPVLLLVAVVAACAAPAPASPTQVPSEPPGDGWARFPLEPVAGFAEAARTQCLPELSGTGDMDLVVQDQRRANLAGLLFTAAGNDAEIVVEQQPDGTFVCGGGGGGSGSLVSGRDLAITSWTNIGDETTDAWLVSGYVTDRAREVRITLASGAELGASVGGGRFLAMWQGPQAVGLVRALDAGGGEVARVDDELDLGRGDPGDSLIVDVAVAQAYNAADRTMTFRFHASDRGLSPDLGPGWVLNRQPSTAYWEYLGPSGSGESFGEGVEATLTVPCDDLRFGDPGEEVPAWVSVDYRAGDVEKREGFSSRSMTAIGRWDTDLPSCPSDTTSPTP